MTARVLSTAFSAAEKSGDTKREVPKKNKNTFILDEGGEGKSDFTHEVEITFLTFHSFSICPLAVIETFF